MNIAQIPVQRVKIFKGLESELPVLEKTINDWLAQSKVEVIQMVGNIAPQTGAGEDTGLTIQRGTFPPSDIWVMLLYKTL